MSNKHHKDIVELIKKYAKKPPPPPPEYKVEKPAEKPVAGTPAPRTHTPPKPGQPAPDTSGHTGFAKSPNVEKMQIALINLSKAVQAQVKAEDVAKVNVEKDDKGQDKATATPEASEAAGRASFSDFTAQIGRDSPTPGVEFDTTPSKIKMTDKQPSEMTRMYSVMNTMSRPGGPASEITPDGKWGPRTNAALQNAYAFAYAMLKLAGEFKLPIKSYTDSDLGSFVIPKVDSELGAQQKHEQASALTKHVEAIHRMFEEVKRGILENPEHQAYIENNQPFLSYKKVVPLGPSEKALKATWSTQRLPGNDVFVNMPQPGGTENLQAKINYTDLTSPEAFNKWYDSQDAAQLKQVGVDRPTVISAIRKALQAKASGGV